MAEPAIELDVQDEMASSPTYDINIITGGTVDTDKVLRWGAPDSADGAITNVTLPTSGNKWAEELWLEDLSTTDLELLNATYDPDAGTQAYMTFKITSNAVSFATAPRITVYDSSSHTEAEEVCVGTTAHTSPFIKGRIATSSAQPAQWWGEASSAALHALETGGGVTPAGNNALCGDTNYLECGTTDINGTPQYFMLALSIPDDATTGVDSIDCVFSIRYTYT